VVEYLIAYIWPLVVIVGITGGLGFWVWCVVRVTDWLYGRW
jgi:hypothetical protein